MSDLSQPNQAPAVIDALQWRYATKKMDASKAVPQEKVERILEAARLAPTSSGLQQIVGADDIGLDKCAGAHD